MRLIDADKLVEICRKGWRLFGFSDEKICHWVDEYDINAQPTVKAITVEWIKRYIAEEGIYPNRELLSVEQADAIERMIENWEKENE